MLGIPPESPASATHVSLRQSITNGKHLGYFGQKSKNNEILQEFYFSHPKSKIKVNSIYNSHFCGSCLWDLFSKEAGMVENTWNVSMRLMLDIPRETHRYLIEPLSSTTRVKTIVIKRFLSFLDQIRKSSKSASNFLFNSILLDARSTTDSNLRNILLRTDKRTVIRS